MKRAILPLLALASCGAPDRWEAGVRQGTVLSNDGDPYRTLEPEDDWTIELGVSGPLLLGRDAPPRPDPIAPPPLLPAELAVPDELLDGLATVVARLDAILAAGENTGEPEPPPEDETMPGESTLAEMVSAALVGLTAVGAIWSKLFGPTVGGKTSWTGRGVIYHRSKRDE